MSGEGRKSRIPEGEIVLKHVRGSGPGGQKVNKTSSTVQLFFDIPRSSLPDWQKERMLALADHRVNEEGLVVIKSGEHRSLEKNIEAAEARLDDLWERAMAEQKKRRPTKPSRRARERRLTSKALRGKVKGLRRSPSSEI
ncbi:MAG: alternative ribosome rescue aminoacyl-tRNA hydrolase ArfB [Puniceicoccaceae bacterium]